MTGGGIQTSTTLYFAEIADDNIRGKLSMSYSLSRNTGILFAYVAGIYINYMQLSIIGAMICVIFVTSYCGLPSTPKYLLQIGADHVRMSWISDKLNCKISKIHNRKREMRWSSTKVVPKMMRIQIWSKHSRECKQFRWNQKKIPNWNGVIYVSEFDPTYLHFNNNFIKFSL